MYAGLGFTHLHCNISKVQKDVFFPIPVLLEIAHAIPHVVLRLKKKQIFLRSVRENASKQKKQFLVLLVYADTHTHTHTHTHIYIYRATANIVIVMKQL